MAIGACVANNSNDWPVKDLSCIDQVQLIEMRMGSAFFMELRKILDSNISKKIRKRVLL